MRNLVLGSCVKTDVEIFSALALLGATALQVQHPPVLWLEPSGQILIRGREVTPHVVEGVRTYRTQHGVTYDFNGRRSALEFGDAPALRLTGSVTVSTWINLRSYVNDGPGAQVLFRGDDRNGLDPYSMAVGNGFIGFEITGQDGDGRSVIGDIPTGVWTHVVASYDAENGVIQLWINGDLKAMTKTVIRPFPILDGGFAPGVSVGNVQNDHGPHNQPLNGMIADLRVYDVPLTPEEIGYNGGGGVEPPLARVGH